MDNWMIVIGITIFALSYLFFVYKFFENKHDK